MEVVGLRERDAGNGSDSGDLDRASSAKYLDVVPVGMLPQDRNAKFRFGVSIYPSLYADALYALDTELDRIFETDVSVPTSTFARLTDDDLPSALGRFIRHSGGIQDELINQIGLSVLSEMTSPTAAGDVLERVL